MGARELLAELTGVGMGVEARGDRLLIRPAGKLTDAQRAALRAAKPELLALLRPLAPSWWGWDDATIARFISRRNRLLRLGWLAENAEAVADRLARRDEEGDDRVACVECANLVRGRCTRHRQAEIGAEVGRDLASRLQRCNAFKAQP
jgi:hypothetical protein